MVCIACVGFFFSLATSAGWRPAYAFSGLCGVVLVVAGLITRRELHQGIGTALATASAFLFVGGTIGPPNNQSAALVSCPIQVTDMSGKPIRGASVRMREVDLPSLPSNVAIESISSPASYGTVVGGTTDAAGRIWPTYSFRFVSIRGWFSERPFIAIPSSLWIQVDAAGYERKSIRLETITGADYDWFDLPFPEIAIQLEAN